MDLARSTYYDEPAGQPIEEARLVERIQEICAEWPSYGYRRVTAQLHAEGILAYVRSGLSNGRTEGLNGKARTITRRAYGFHSASALIALLMLCCSGIKLEPVTLTPGSTH